MFFQNSNCLIQNVTLGDTAEIKARPRLGEFGGALFSVQLESAKAYCLQGLIERVLRWKPLDPTRLAPKLNRSPCGHIECTTCQHCQCLSAVEHAEQLRTDRNRLTATSQVRQLIQLAVRLVIAHDLVEHSDPVERRLCRPLGLRFILRMDDDPKRHPHQRPRKFVALRLAS